MGIGLIPNVNQLNHRNINRFVNLMTPKIAPWGGRKFKLIGTKQPFSMREILNVVQLILLNINTHENKREVLNKIRELDAECNTMLQESPWYIRFLTAIRSVFGNIGFDKQKVFANLEAAVE